MIEYSAEPNKSWLIYNYEPGAIAPLTTSGRAKFLGLWFVAKKHIEARCDVIPQQGYYLRTWAKSKSNGELKDIKSEVKWYGEGKFVRLKKIIKSNEIAYLLSVKLYRFFIGSYRTSLSMPKVIAKY